jgi:ATP-binding cassette subfamily B multidrug efflux pump
VIDLLKRYLAPFRRELALVIGLLFAQSIANLYLPELNADIINNGVVRGDLDYIWRTGAVMIVVTLLFGAASVAGAYWGARVAMGFGRDLRSAVFRKVQTFSQVEVNHFGTPSLITRNTNDVQQVQQFIVMALAMMISAPILAIGGAIMALRQDVPLSGMLLVIIPLMGLVIGSILRRAIPQFQAMQLKIDRINLVVREALSGVRVVRAFVRTRQEERRFDDANQDLTATALRVNRLFSLMMPALMVIMNLSTVAALWFGAIRVDSGAMPIGNFTAFLQYIIQILFGVMMATIMFVMVPRAAVSSARIQEVLLAEPSVRDPDVPLAPPRGQGVIEFRDVEFRYPGAEEPVLRGISFIARPGETTAIVGSTGSGKSTLVNLLTRFYDVTGGAVLLDGVDVRQLRRDDLWSRIGVVAQRALLFSGTVASNLRFGRDDASDDDLWRALDIAQGGFVRDMPGGLDAQVSQGGTNVSGGQRQRLAIARALVKRPDVYLFDDSFSALDVKTDARLRAALRREVADATVLVVAQRVATIMQAERIIVLDAGRIVGIGTHGELMTACPTYREIVESQLAGSEVAA